MLFAYLLNLFKIELWTSIKSPINPILIWLLDYGDTESTQCKSFVYFFDGDFLRTASTNICWNRYGSYLFLYFWKKIETFSKKAIPKSNASTAQILIC